MLLLTNSDLTKHFFLFLEFQYYFIIILHCFIVKCGFKYSFEWYICFFLIMYFFWWSLIHNRCFVLKQLYSMHRLSGQFQYGNLVIHITKNQFDAMLLIVCLIFIKITCLVNWKVFYLFTFKAKHFCVFCDFRLGNWGLWWVCWHWAIIGAMQHL